MEGDSATQAGQRGIAKHQRKGCGGILRGCVVGGLTEGWAEEEVAVGVKWVRRCQLELLGVIRFAADEGDGSSRDARACQHPIKIPAQQELS